MPRAITCLKYSSLKPSDDFSDPESIAGKVLLAAQIQPPTMRDMIDWFAGQEDFPPPGERTVRRKVSAIWRELKLAWH
jgi:hypothetical protein